MNDKFASKRERKIRRGAREGEIHVTGCLLECTALPTGVVRVDALRIGSRIIQKPGRRFPFKARVQFSQICSRNGLYSHCPDDQPMGTLETSLSTLGTTGD